MSPDLRTTGPEPAPLDQGPWPLRSRRRAALTAIGVGAVVFCTAFFIERYLHEQGTDPLPMIAVSNAMAAALATFLLMLILHRIIDRRREIIKRLRVIAEINHHIRNGLELIQLSAITTENERAISIIREGVQRIEWALRELLGPGGPLADTAASQSEQQSKAAENANHAGS